MMCDDQLLALVTRVLAEAADYLDGCAGGHYMAQSCATALRDDGLALEIADRACSSIGEVCEHHYACDIWPGGLGHCTCGVSLGFDMTLEDNISAIAQGIETRRAAKEARHAGGFAND